MGSETIQDAYQRDAEILLDRLASLMEMIISRDGLRSSGTLPCRNSSASGHGNG
jgi:uncharacterized protein YutE (UPF0331/DUF86 family)